MKRREFFEKGGCGLIAGTLAYFGLTSCAKKEEVPAESPVQAPPEETSAPVEEMTREEMVKNMMVEKMGMTEEEAEAKLIELEEKLPMIKEKCLCATCPSYIPEETALGFCHPMVGKSDLITEKKGCDCPNCPVYQMMEMKNGYYCIKGSEMEIEASKEM